MSLRPITGSPAVRRRSPFFCLAFLAGAGMIACGEEGDECTADGDCADGLVCRIGSCVDPDSGFGNGNGNGNTNGNNVNGNNNNDNDNVDDGVDTDGPTIIIREPDPYEPVSGTIEIVVDVVDAESGVDTDSVYAIVADQVLVPLLPTSNATRFVATYDTLPLRALLAPSLEIVAEDLEGNETTVGNSFILDYAGPAIDLDPRDLRPYFQSDGGGVRCGGLIPVLGDTALQDGQIIAPQIPMSAPNPDAYEPFLGLAFYPRASILDRASEGPYDVSTPVSGVDLDSVVFALLDSNAIDAGRSLVTSNTATRSDGLCNALNPEIIPPPGSTALDAPVAVLQQAIRTQVGGFPDFSADLVEFREPGISVTTPPFPCAGWGLTAETTLFSSPPDPAPVCRNVDPLWTAIDGGNVVQGVPLSRVFVANDYNPQSIALCAGGFFDSLNLVSDGPACVTAYARDEIGNEAVGAPLYICIDKDGAGGECDGFNPTLVDKLNACTDGCVPEDPGGDPDLDSPLLRGF